MAQTTASRRYRDLQRPLERGDPALGEATPHRSETRRRWCSTSGLPSTSNAGSACVRSRRSNPVPASELTRRASRRGAGATATHACADDPGDAYSDDSHQTAHSLCRWPLARRSLRPLLNSKRSVRRSTIPNTDPYVEPNEPESPIRSSRSIQRSVRSPRRTHAPSVNAFV